MDWKTDKAEFDEMATPDLQYAYEVATGLIAFRRYSDAQLIKGILGARKLGRAKDWLRLRRLTADQLKPHHDRYVAAYTG